MSISIREPTQSFFDQFVHYPLLNKCEKALLACEHVLDNGPCQFGLREMLFALDHQHMWNSVPLETCCRPVWNLLENECKWNMDMFFKNYIIDPLRGRVPFESLVCIAQLLPMLLNEKSECLVTNCTCRQETFAFDLREPRPVLVATAFDGTCKRNVEPSPPCKPTICITGRTWQELTKDIRNVMQEIPVYFRGQGAIGDKHASAVFKASMINQFKVTHFLEDDQTQIDIIQSLCPAVVICKTVS